MKAELSGDEDYDSARFVEPRIPDSEARERWPLRYRGKVVEIHSRNIALGFFFCSVV